LVFDFLSILLRRKNDDVVLHIDYLDFNNRTQRRAAKLHHSFSKCGIGMDFGSGDCFGQIGGADSTAWLNGRSALKVLFDAQGFVDIAFPPQIQVRWLSGRKRRFAKALYL
jgi:hypothetical protein